MKWRDIYYAPRDGTLILATDMYEIRIAKFDHHWGAELPKSWGRNGYGDPDFDPKYWMEIPPLNNSAWSNSRPSTTA